VSFAERARALAAQAKQEQEQQRLSREQAKISLAAEQHRKKLAEIQSFASRLSDIVLTEARRGQRKAFIAGGIAYKERELWRPVEARCKELGIRYHMKKNHHPSCMRIRPFYCASTCGNTYHLEVSW